MAISADTSRTDVVAIGEIAKACFPGTGNPKGGKTKSGGYAIAIINRDIGLTQATSIESQKDMTRRLLASRLQCTLKAGRARHLEEVAVDHRMPLADGTVQEVYWVKGSLAALDAQPGWEKLDPDDADDMRTLWGHLEVLKDNWEGLELN